MSIDNPQLADGYTALANPIMDQLARVQLSGHEWRVLLFLFRKTYGWSKTSDLISLSQFSDGTGLSIPNATHAITRLIRRGMIVKVTVKINNTKATRYQFNKHSADWKVLPKSTVHTVEINSTNQGQCEQITAPQAVDPQDRVLPKSTIGVLPKSTDTTTRKDTTREVPKDKVLWQDDPDEPDQDPVPYQDLVDLWRSVCVPAGMHNVRDVDRLKAKMKAAWYRMEQSKDPELVTLDTLGRFKALLTKAAGSAFLCGHNDRQWAADMEFVLRPLSVERIMDGYYSHGVQEMAPGTYVRGGVAVHVNPSPASRFSAEGLNDKIRIEPDDDTDTIKEW